MAIAPVLVHWSSTIQGTGHVICVICVTHGGNTETQGGHSIVKNTGGAGSIVWGLGFWLGRDILGFFKNIGLDNSQGVAKIIHTDN